MIAEVITIGDELLMGDTVDTNSTWIAGNLDLIGIKTKRITTISDDLEAIQTCLELALKSVDLIIITGGLGPTHDDITKHALADYFGDELVFNEFVFKQLEARLKSFGKEVNSLNRTQAMLPSSCRIIENDKGTAPGMIFEKNNTTIISMPGVPFEMKGMMQSVVIPELKKNLNVIIHHRHLKTFGMAESEMAQQLESVIRSLDSRIKLAFLPSPGHVKLRLSASGAAGDGLEKLLDQAELEIRNIFGNALYGREYSTLENELAQILITQGKTISTAESCTGGGLASRLTSIAGSSAYFIGSIIAYSNEVKMNQLDIDESMLVKNGAVSKEVVEAMAVNSRKKFSTDYALATSGIAGPDGGTAEKPVGTIWIGMATPDGVKSKLLRLGFERRVNVRLTVDYAMDLLRKELLYKV